MTQLTTLDPIDYLLIGHVTADLQADQSISLGGTASFSGLTAARLGHNVGLVTSCASDLQLDPLIGIQKWVIPSEKSTVFRNEGLGRTRVQHLYSSATRITADHIPAPWRDCQLVHLGPIAAEIDPNIVELFPHALVCLTPQGWYRQADDDGLVRYVDWPEGLALLARADAVVLSIEDLKGDEQKVKELAGICPLLVVTESRDGARVLPRARSGIFLHLQLRWSKILALVTFCGLFLSPLSHHPGSMGSRTFCRSAFSLLGYTQTPGEYPNIGRNRTG